MPTSSGSLAARVRNRATPAPPSSTVGPWRLGPCLHRGPFTDLYLAEVAGQRTPGAYDYVAKLPAVGEDRSTAARLLIREAAVAAAVRHPHLTTVLAGEVDCDEDGQLRTGGSPYLILPRYQGCSLDAILEGGKPAPVGSALWLARQVAEAVGALHQSGWLHGDIKPSNVMVGPDGHTTLIDLGFAQRVPSPNATARVLQCTPAYAAPELVLEGVCAGTRSDSYSLGALLYELLTGARHYSLGDSNAQQTVLPTGNPTDIRRLRPELPLGVAALVRRLLHREPDERPEMEATVQRLVELEVECFDWR